MENKMHINELLPQKALLAAADLGEYDIEVSLNELEELATTAGAIVLGQITQKRDSLDTATCLGSGRMEEAAEFCKQHEVDLIIFDHELTASQIRNIEKLCECKVVDRTMLILDIFAQRAHTAEGRLQVELAQQKYLLPRLSGMSSGLSRLGGGIGTRGPGETKLESDRRHIRRRIKSLEEQIEEIAQRRLQMRKRRKKDSVTTVAIVGYTNVGKSTLLNALTDAGVLAEDKLFATLDPTARALLLPSGRSIMLVDTVGLVRRLPHHLVAAFRSTLEEAAYSDVLLNVCDATSEEMQEQISVTLEILQEMGAADTPVITVLNKCDMLTELPIGISGDVVPISAKTGEGFEKLLTSIENALQPTHKRTSIIVPYTDVGLISEIRALGTIFLEEYREDGILVDALIDIKLLHRCKNYFVD